MNKGEGGLLRIKAEEVEVEMKTQNTDRLSSPHVDTPSDIQYD